MIKRSAIILSGGKNSRMNYNTKAFLNFNGERFIDRIINVVSNFEEKIISCNDRRIYKIFEEECTIVEDSIKEIGPIGGIYEALKNSIFEEALVVAADMPFLNKDLINKLGSMRFDGDILVLKTGDKIQPLCSVYKKRCLYTIEEMIKEKNYKMMELIKRSNVTYLQSDDKENFFNINTPDEYKELVKKREDYI